MKISKGSKVINITLPSIDGTYFSSENLTGKPFMISFFRFASCPFCNLRVHELVTRFNELGKDFTIVAVFDSSIDNLTENAQKHHAPFPILADKENTYYNKYGIERSVKGMLKGMVFRFPTLVKGILNGYIPLKIKGSLITMPADFLVDREGIVREAYYGKDEGDHLPFDVVKEFSLR